MNKKHYPDGMPKIWPWLDEDDTRYVALGAWVYRVVDTMGSSAIYLAASRRIIAALGRHLQSACDIMSADPRCVALRCAAWNKTGEELGYTVWATKKEGNGR